VQRGVREERGCSARNDASSLLRSRYWPFGSRIQHTLRPQLDPFVRGSHVTSVIVCDDSSHCWGRMERAKGQGRGRGSRRRRRTPLAHRSNRARACVCVCILAVRVMRVRGERKDAFHRKGRQVDRQLWRGKDEHFLN